MNNICVYRHLKPCGEVFYVGIGNSKRPYKKYDSNRNKHWINIKNKYGYSVEILYNNLSWEDACELEQFLIKLYGRKDLGLGTLVNMTDGGDGFYGGKHSDETKLKCAKGRKNKRISEEHKLKIRLANKGKVTSLETKNKISKSLKLNKRPKGIIKKKKLINIITGKIYNSIQECSRVENINYSTLWRQLKNKTTTTCNFKYLENNYE